jgi:imidazole glycerol-phosphate synthase subunit HisF
VLASIDVRGSLRSGARVVTCCGLSPTTIEPVDMARRAVDLGAGEILLTSIDRDGVMAGYDIELIEAVAAAVPVPVIACGGAGVLADFAHAVLRGHAQAAAAGSMLVYQNKNRQVLINFPSKRELREALAVKGAAS